MVSLRMIDSDLIEPALQQGECSANKATDILFLDGAMHEAVAAIASCGVSPVVRVAANEGWMVKRSFIPEVNLAIAREIVNLQ